MLIVSLLLSASGHALELLEEADLAQTVAQDGLDISFILPTNGWTINTMQLTDQSGIPATIKPGYEFNAGNILFKDIAVRGCVQNSIGGDCTSAGTHGFRLILDSVGNIGDGSPMLNIQTTLSGATQKVRVYMDKIAIRNSLGLNEATLIDFNNRDTTVASAYLNRDYIDFLPTTSTLFTLQLGGELSGRMISFGATSFNTINLGEIRLVDKVDTGFGGNGRNLRFGLTLTDVNLSNAGLDMTPEGLAFSTPSLTGLDITMSNITTNTSGVTMGSIGVRDLNLSQHSLILTGK
ncbi:hypothetical protein [Agitococcus lubricus]|nr:hypothetical protein [Agitococcus lubricus]